MKRSVYLGAMAVLLLVVSAASALAQQSRVFVTSTTSNGDLGGLAGADMTCNDLATTAGLGGTWVAWLSASGSGTNAVDRLTATGPFVRASDTMTVIADDIIDLTNGDLDNPIEFDENGGIPSPLVWTGTSTSGTATGNDCSDWTSTAGLGLIGASMASTNNWTDNANATCDSSVLGIYCFEQDAPIAPTLPTPFAIALVVLLLGGGALLYRRRQAQG